MNAVRKVDWRCACWKVFNVAIGGVDEDLILKNVGSNRGKVFVVTRKFALPVEKLAQPRHLGFEIVDLWSAVFTFLVHPVRGDTFFSDFVHFLCSDLHLNRVVAGSSH